MAVCLALVFGGHRFNRIKVAMARLMEMTAEKARLRLARTA
jgi:hypothetical protein